jgi:hypothetical protein
MGNRFGIKPRQVRVMIFGREPLLARTDKGLSVVDFLGGISRRRRLNALPILPLCTGFADESN